MGTPQTEIEASYSVLRFKADTLRPTAYWNFILSRWMRSFRYGNDYMKLADSDSYYRSYEIYLTLLLYKPEAVVRLAVLTDDPDVALGFSVVRGPILDYVHVHKDFRKQGIGKKLVPNDIETITHLTKTGMKLWSTKLPKATFDPFI